MIVYFEMFLFTVTLVALLVQTECRTQIPQAHGLFASAAFRYVVDAFFSSTIPDFQEVDRAPDNLVNIAGISRVVLRDWSPPRETSLALPFFPPGHC